MTVAHLKVKKNRWANNLYRHPCSIHRVVSLGTNIVMWDLHRLLILLASPLSWTPASAASIAQLRGHQVAAGAPAALDPLSCPQAPTGSQASTLWGCNGDKYESTGRLMDWSFSGRWFHVACTWSLSLNPSLPISFPLSVSYVLYPVPLTFSGYAAGKQEIPNIPVKVATAVFLSPLVLSNPPHWLWASHSSVTVCGPRTHCHVFLTQPPSRLRTTCCMKADVKKDYGAVGDNSTDDSDAFLAAIAGTKDGALFIPAGTYRITKQLKLHGNMVLRGEGPTKTILYIDEHLTNVCVPSCLCGSHCSLW